MKNPLALTLIVLAGLASPLAAQSFYKDIPIFSTAPGTDKSMNLVGRFGPVGLGIELHQPPFVMHVGDIEPGSPAAAAGGLKKGQIIESINGQALKDIDPRIQLGRILEAAEAGDGLVKFKVKDAADAAASEVVVKIPVLGAYSKTWPLDCPKSDKVMRLFADQIAKPDGVTGFGGGAMLTLLGTGDDRYLPAVKAWVDKLAKEKGGTIPWRTGIGGIALCEYYLRTGDPVALEVIQSWVDISTQQEYLDGWAGRGGVVGLGYGSGHLNAGGTQVVTFLMLAKQCGAKINDSLLHRTLTHFFRFAGRGVNPYGDHRPETSFVDNGKNGNLSFAMAAAALLTPEGEDSLYAKARDITAMSSFYTTTYMLHGHTGGGVGEVWRSAAMGFLHEKKPLQYREFMDGRKWHYDLSRRFDGTNAILGGAGYDNTEWGGLYTWAYIMPRKTLRITGAPPSKYSKTFQLPKRPWGTAADDVFLSLEAAPDKDGKRMDVSGELLAKDSAKPLIDRIQAKGELSDEEIRRYVRHPEYLIRHMIANHAAGMTCAYMFTKPECRVRPDLIKEFAHDADPRVRNAGLRAAITAFNPEADWCKELYAHAIERLKDDEESWYVKDACLALVAKGTPDMILPHVDLLASYLKHPEQWLQNGALVALTQISDDERGAEKVLPVIAEFIRKTPRQSTTGGPLYLLQQKMPAASGKVRDVAVKALGDIYANYINPKAWEGGQDLTGHSKQTYDLFAETLAAVPGGYDVLYKLGKQRQPDAVLPHEALFLGADPNQFGPELQNAIRPIIREKLIYQYVAKNRNRLFSEIGKPSQKGVVTDSVDGLVDLYQKIGVHDYDWKEVGGLSKAKWNYFSFDPPEKQAYDKTPWRYRAVTVPKGMEQWNAPGFDAAKAGWKSGEFPIGQYEGKLADNGKSGRNLWPQPPKSLWENEVLLVTGSFPLPAFKPGHRYRLRVDRGQGVGAGDGFKVFINGKLLVESTEGLGRRGGDTIRGGWLTEEFAEEFAKGPVTVSAITFLRYGDRAIVQMPPVPQGIFSMWIEERKLPPLDAPVLQKAVEHVPMMTSDYKVPDADASGEEAAEKGVYRYDGKFVANPALLGKWTMVGMVDSIDAFVGGAKPVTGRSPLRAITIKDGGLTDSNAWFWSGDLLFDLDGGRALKATPKNVGGADYLLVEAGAWGPKPPPGGFKPQWVVMKR